MNTVPAISVVGLKKIYASGFQALKGVDLEINKGEIFALLGPNGAGKTTLINIVCGLVRPTSGKVCVDGFDIIGDYRQTRSRIGLVPQEIATDMFEKVRHTVELSRGLFGKAPSPATIEKTLKTLSLWDKRDQKIMTLSGGMKRRLMIAKALAHEPSILFLDEPTAGVDVALRRDMWDMVRDLRKNGVTIVLTTHYIEEAQEMADRIGVINKGEIVVTEKKEALMQKLGKKRLTLNLSARLDALPANMPSHLQNDRLLLEPDGMRIHYVFDASAPHTGIGELLAVLSKNGIGFNDLQTKESSLEEIFLTLIGNPA